MTPPRTTSFESLFELAPGQQRLVCLPGGSALQGLEGRIQVHLGHPHWNPALPPVGMRYLEAGQRLSGDDGGPNAAMGHWLVLHNPGTDAVHVLCIAAPPRPWLHPLLARMLRRWAQARPGQRTACASHPANPGTRWAKG